MDELFITDFKRVMASRNVYQSLKLRTIEIDYVEKTPDLSHST